MTILICTGFYIYVIFSVNVYRKEILLRQKEGCVIKGKVKAVALHFSANSIFLNEDGIYL